MGGQQARTRPSATDSTGKGQQFVRHDSNIIWRAERLITVGAALSLAWGSLIANQAAKLDELEVTVQKVGPLAKTSPPFPLVESFLVVNPADPENLLASAMSVSTDSSLIYGSWDGASTWKQVSSPEGQAFPGGDPILAFDGNGRAYFATITPAFNVWYSEDGGRSGAGPVTAGESGAYDR